MCNEFVRSSPYMSSRAVGKKSSSSPDIDDDDAANPLEILVVVVLVLVLPRFAVSFTPPVGVLFVVVHVFRCWQKCCPFSRGTPKKDDIIIIIIDDDDDDCVVA